MTGTDQPAVSVVIANYNGNRFIESALRAVLAQTLADIEVIVVDDASTDGSVARIREVGKGDARVRLLQTKQNSGPAAARNKALDEARGKWIAVVDSDDLIHPNRLARLLDVAESDAADIVADNLLVFDDAGVAAPTCHLHGTAWAQPTWITTSQYIYSNVIFGRQQTLGYLKPLFRGDLIRRGALRYDASLRIGEDYDFVLRLLASGARFRFVPDITYFYRKHSKSVSHRLARDTLEAMLTADDAFRLAYPQHDPALLPALSHWRASVERAIAFVDLIEAIKARRLKQAAGMMWRRPDVVPLLRLPLASGLSRLLFGSRKKITAPNLEPSACVISRQRMVGAINGSSVYLLSLLRSLHARGIKLHLVMPSPATFGRWPGLIMAPEMRLFASIKMRGAWRIGRVFVARDPRVLGVALLTIADRLLVRLGLSSNLRVKPAPYAIAMPWTTKDFLFVARNTRQRADMLIADYAFATPSLPYALRPDAPTVVVMHDLFSGGTHHPEESGADGLLANLDLESEMRLLSQAEVVVAIQSEEADVVRRRLPGRRVMVAPMAVTPVALPEPGDGYEVLFVGSDAGPNKDGLDWFLSEIWPVVRSTEPRAVLVVAGSVGRAFNALPDGVQRLGQVADLQPLYRRAAVVVSPLRIGSGLKIKFVEALACGKAMVVTRVTLQGIEDVAGHAVEVVDDPTDFAAAVANLLANPALRRARGQAALEVARAAFSPERCHTELATFLLGAVGTGAENSASCGTTDWKNLIRPPQLFASPIQPLRDLDRNDLLL